MEMDKLKRVIIGREMGSEQCNQIGRFIGLWATFKKTLATINLPKSPTFLSNFCRKIYFRRERLRGNVLEKQV